MNRQLVLLPLALGSLALAGCSTAPRQNSGGDYSGPAAWSYFASATDGSAHYIDYNSIRRDGPRARVWARHEFEKTALSEGTRVRSARALRELDCSSQQWRLLSITVFSAPGLGGEQVSRHDGPGSWQQIPPQNRRRGQIQSRLQLTPRQRQDPLRPGSPLWIGCAVRTDVWKSGVSPFWPHSHGNTIAPSLT